MRNQRNGRPQALGVLTQMVSLKLKITQDCPVVLPCLDRPQAFYLGFRVGLESKEDLVSQRFWPPKNCFVCPQNSLTHVSPSSGQKQSRLSEEPAILLKATGLSLRGEPTFLKSPPGDRSETSLCFWVSSGGFLSL